MRGYVCVTTAMVFNLYLRVKLRGEFVVVVRRQRLRDR
jgi:hypothetical protein